MNDYKHLIREITLSQRVVQYEFRKQTSLNRVDLEIMCFAFKNQLFNSYQVRQFFVEMNVQLVLRTIKSLIDLEVLEVMRKGIKGNPAIYMLSLKGHSILDDYFADFEKSLNS